MLKNFLKHLIKFPKTKLKKLFLPLVNRLKEQYLIQSDFQVINDGLRIYVNQLTPTNIETAFVLYEKLSI